MNSTNVNIAEILQRRGVDLGDKPAIVHGDRVISYAELARNVRRRAAWFRERGVEPGEGILVVVPMSIDLYEIMIAIFHAGGVAVFLDAWSDRERIEQARRSISITGFIAPRRAHLLRLVSQPLRSIAHHFTPRIPGRFSGEMTEPVHLGGDARALVTFTTGSTGQPRGADRTHRHLRAQHRAIVETFGPAASDIDLATLPIFPLSNLGVGSTTVLPDIDFRRPADFDPEQMLATIRERRVTTAALSPAFIHRLSQTPDVPYLPDLRRLLVGGASITPELARSVRRGFPDTELLAVYGSTEAEPIALLTFDELILESDSSWRDGLPAGRPIDGIDLRIISTSPVEGGEPASCAAGEAGEICVRGPHVLENYVDEPMPGTAERGFIEIDGERWLRTGDGGTLSREGELRLLGRVSRRIERTGHETLWPIPVESLLSGIDEVSCGTAIEEGGRIFYVLEPDHGEPGADGVSPVEAVGKAIDEFDLPPGEVIVVERIPRDPRHASKISYRELVEEIRSGLQADGTT